MKSIIKELRQQYLLPDSKPWIVGFSAGKDSTLLLQLVIEAVRAIAPSDRRRQVHVINNDTGVESPVYQEHVNKVMSRVADLADSTPQMRSWLHVHITHPEPEHTFWFLVIGRGYRAPTRHFRWCTDRLKIRPSQGYINQLTEQYGPCVLLLGARSAESTTRATSIERHSGDGLYSPHASIPHVMTYLPIRDVQTEDLWAWLLQNPAPWGGRHRDLWTLYRNAEGGECPLVLGAESAPACGSGSMRFGCWVCTVVTRDRSARGLIDAGFDHLEPLLDLRDWLQQISQDPETRWEHRTDGSNGLGPFKIEIRKEILSRLLKAQQETGLPLLSQEEQARIEQEWGKHEAEMLLARVDRLQRVRKYVLAGGAPVWFETSRDKLTDEDRQWREEERKRHRRKKE